MTQAQLQNTDNSPKPVEEHGERRWYDFFGFSTDHKVIGIQYLVTSFIFYCIGGVMADLV
ncbi:MAG: cytochrome c oxidase subunit, partial [Cyanobacteriota bacterium]